MINDESISDYWHIILISFAASLLLSFTYVYLIKAFPKIMVYLSIVLTLAVFAALAIYGLIIGQIGLTIAMVITLLIYILILGCLRNKIALGILLVELSTRFMADRPSVFFAPFFNIVLTSIIGIFWTFCLSIIIKNMNDHE